jgi:LAO/AO transport system kinase
MKSTDDGFRAVDAALWDGFLAGRRLSCARLISLVENDPASVPEIRDRLIPLQKGGIRIGITGPPGVGKSTVAASLARRSLRAGHAVGIIAVDPSSPFTGGAFLGDRVRMQTVLDDDRVFIRSLASRDGRGGLSPATPHVADVFDAFGMDRILIETVGVGQTELDVLDCADLVILVLQPSTGDVIQALKAGILEIADMFLINKSDLPGAESLLESLRFLFEISARKEGAAPPVLIASALKEQGMDEVHAELERRIADLIASGRLEEKKRRRMEREIRDSIRDCLWERFAALTDGKSDIPALAAELARSGRSPYPVIREICRGIRLGIQEEKTSREERGKKRPGRKHPES